MQVKDKVTKRADTGRQLIRQYITQLPSLVTGGLKYHMAGKYYTPRPGRIGLIVTKKCNARCIMCPVWREGHGGQELTVSEIKGLMSSPLLKSVKSIDFGGGEPTLREDLPEIVRIVLDSQPGIGRMGMATNGLEPVLVRRQVKEIAGICEGSGTQFAVGVSIDGFGDTHEKIRRVSHAFDRVSETIRLLQELRTQTRFDIHLNCVVQPLNIKELPQLRGFARELGIHMQFIPVYIHRGVADNDNDRQQLEMPPGYMEELKSFFSNQQYNVLPIWKALWQDYFRITGGGKRRFPCALLNHNLAVDMDGTVFICEVDKSLAYGNIHDAPIDEIWYSAEAKEVREKVKRDYCVHCAVACDISFSLRQEFFYFARFLVKDEGKKLLRAFQRGH